MMMSLQHRSRQSHAKQAQPHDGVRGSRMHWRMLLEAVENRLATPEPARLLRRVSGQS